MGVMVGDDRSTLVICEPSALCFAILAINKEVSKTVCSRRQAVPDANLCLHEECAHSP